MNTKNLKRKMNKKLMLSIVMLVLVSIGSIAGIVTVLALNSRTIDSAMFVRFMAIDIDGEVEAAYKVGDSGSWTSMSGTTPHVFDAADAETNTQMNPGDIKLSSSNNYVEFRYTFRNFGDADYTGLLTLDEVAAENNMKIEYKYNESAYSTSSYGLVVEGVDSADSSKIKTRGTEKYTEMVYYVKVSVLELSKSANYSSDFFWLLERYDGEVTGEAAGQVIPLATSEYTANGDGTYSAAYKGADISVSGTSAGTSNISNVWTVPSKLGSAAVTNIKKGDDLPADTKVVISDGIKTIEADVFTASTGLVDLYIGNGVTSIPANEFKNCTNLRNITIGSGVTSIGTYAFYYCTAVEVLNYNANVTTEFAYSNYVFSSLGSKATKTIVNVNGPTVPAYLFNQVSTIDEVNLLSNVRTVEKYAFHSTNIESLTISEGVTKIGENAFSYNRELTSVDIPNSVTNVGTNAFFACSLLTNLKIGKGLTSLGSAAFSNCSKLNSIYLDPNNTSFIIENKVFINKEKTIIYFSVGGNSIPATVQTIQPYCFYGRDDITEITIPSSVKTIGAYAFYNCSNLTNIDIPNSVTSIGGAAFQYCSKLETAIIGDGVSSLGSNTFENCGVLTDVVLGSKIITLPSGLFKNCEKLTNLTIKGPLTSINSSVFYGCRNLTELELPSTVTTIAAGAFVSCYGLKNITIPSGVKILKEDTFQFCMDLENVTLSEGLETIEKNAFDDCRVLAQITIPSTVTSIAAGAFDRCYKLVEIRNLSTVTIKSAHFGYNTSPTVTVGNTSIISTDSNGLQYAEYETGKYEVFNYTGTDAELTIPSTYNGGVVTKISQYAFYENSNIQKVTISEGITSIEYGAFEISSVANLIIPDSVTTIGEYVFYSCSNLKSVSIGKGCTSFGSSIFSGCTNLTDVTIKEGATKLGNYMFSGCTKLTSITIPSTITNMGSSPFSGCSNLLQIYDLRSTQMTAGSYGTPSDVRILSAGNAPLITTDSNGFTYFEYETGKYKIISYSGTATELVIPATYNGGIVTGIRKNAFSGNTNLTSVVISNGITSIGSYAFSSCYNLISINIPDSIITIGSYAFGECVALKTINLGTNIKTIDSGAFWATGLESVIIPASVTFIGMEAFYTNDLRSATFENPNGWTYVGYDYETGEEVLYEISSTILSDPTKAAEALCNYDYGWEGWTRSE